MVDRGGEIVGKRVPLRMATMKKLPPTQRTREAITTMACLTLMFRLRVIMGKNFQMQNMSTPKRLKN